MPSLARSVETAASLRDLVQRARRAEAQTADVGVQPAFLPATGFHVYAELKLPKKLSAPESAPDAEKALRAIVLMTRLADRCAREEGGELLEAQGEIVHVFSRIGIEGR